MSSQGPAQRREEQHRLSLRTLAIAAVASATAAVLTSKFWTSGTPIAAALTPVIVALVSEMLHRPTERIAERFTARTTGVLPDAAGAGPPPERQIERRPSRAYAEPGSEPEGAGMRVYRRPAGRRRIAVGVVVATAVLAFAIAASALTLPELIAGGSLGKGDRKTTLFGGHKKKKERADETETAPAQTQTQTEEQQTQTEEQPSETETAPGGGKDKTTPTATETIPAP
jgi:hypothetical protein